MPVVLTDDTANNKTVVLADNIFENFITTGIADDPLNPYINAENDQTFSFWRQGGTAITRLRKIGDIFNATASACGISGHNLGTTGSRLYILYSDDGTTWLNATPPYDPVTDEDLLFIFPQRTHLYWEVAFGLSTGAYVSNVKLGRRLDWWTTGPSQCSPSQSRSARISGISSARLRVPSISSIRSRNSPPRARARSCATTAA